MTDTDTGSRICFRQIMRHEVKWRGWHQPLLSIWIQNALNAFIWFMNRYEWMMDLGAWQSYATISTQSRAWICNCCASYACCLRLPLLQYIDSMWSHKAIGAPHRHLCDHIRNAGTPKAKLDITCLGCWPLPLQVQKCPSECRTIQELVRVTAFLA